MLLDIPQDEKANEGVRGPQMDDDGCRKTRKGHGFMFKGSCQRIACFPQPAAISILDNGVNPA